MTDIAQIKIMALIVTISIIIIVALIAVIKIQNKKGE